MATESQPGMNRYRLELRHTEQDGTDVEVIAADEDGARAQAATGAPEGTTVERCVLMEVDVKTPEQQEEEAKAKAKADAKAEKTEAAAAEEARDEHGNRASHKPRRSY